MQHLLSVVVVAQAVYAHNEQGRLKAWEFFSHGLKIKTYVRWDNIWVFAVLSCFNPKIVSQKYVFTNTIRTM